VCGSSFNFDDDGVAVGRAKIPIDTSCVRLSFSLSLVRLCSKDKEPCMSMCAREPIRARTSVVHFVGRFLERK